MSDDTSFAEFIRRVRQGDALAAEELVRRFEPEVRMEVRVRLRDPRLRRVFDSTDICQSVLASFFVRAAAGQYDLDQPQDLVRLLVVMARNKLATRSRMERAKRRDSRRVEEAFADQMEGICSRDNPSEAVAAAELLKAFRERLSEEERLLADLRARGEAWAKIAERFGGSAESCRKQLTRALDRVSRQLGLEVDDHD